MENKGRKERVLSTAFQPAADLLGEGPHRAPLPSAGCGRERRGKCHLASQRTVPP